MAVILPHAQNTLPLYGHVCFLFLARRARFSDLWLTRRIRGASASSTHHHAPILARGADLQPRPLSTPLSLIINAVQTPLVAQTSSMANRDALDPPTSLARCIDMRGTSSCRIPRPVDEFIVAPMNAWSTRPLRHGRQLYPLLHLLPRDIFVL